MINTYIFMNQELNVRISYQSAYSYFVMIGFSGLFEFLPEGDYRGVRNTLLAFHDVGRRIFHEEMMNQP